MQEERGIQFMSYVMDNELKQSEEGGDAESCGSSRDPHGNCRLSLGKILDYLHNSSNVL